MVSIRDATTPQDAQLADFSPRGVYRTYLAGFVRGAARGVSALLVAEDDGEIVGRLALDLAKDGPGTLWVLAFEVREGRRSEGIGTALVRAAESWAKRHGASQLRLSVGKDNLDAMRLYERLGYKTIAAGTSSGLVGDDGQVVNQPESVWVLNRRLE